MNEVKLLLKLEHIPEGNKWREFAEKAGVDSLIIFCDLFGGGEEHIPKKEFFYAMAEKAEKEKKALKPIRKKARWKPYSNG